MLGKWSLTVMMFLSVSGGPIGMETALKNTEFYTLMALCFWLLFTYMIPIAVLSYEMTEFHDMMRPSGGPVGWVHGACGNRLGIANAVWDILDTLIDNAIYPILFADNLINIGFISPDYHSIVAWTMIAVTFIINYKELQGVAAILFVIFLMSPFIGIMFVTPMSDMYMVGNGQTSWASMQKAFTILTWSINGFDMASPYAHKVFEPKESYKFAFTVNVLITFVMLIIVFSVGTHYYHTSEEWVDGCFVTMANMAGGESFRIWMGMAACAAAFGVLTAELCATSYLFMGLSKMGFSKKFKSQMFNLVLNVVILSCCVLVNLDTLIEMSAFLNTLTLQCEVFAYIFTWQMNWKRGLVVICLTVNNIIILACKESYCLMAFGFSIGLAIVCIWLSEKTIKVDSYR